MEKWTVSCIRQGMLSASFRHLTESGPPSKRDVASRVLHFGTDDCNRMLVLRSVGYAVDLCSTVEDFHSVLQKRADADAVLVTTGPARERQQVIRLTREHSHAPLVLFNTSYDSAVEAEFDLVIPPQMQPEEWLRDIAALIWQSRALNAASPGIREQSAQFIKRQNHETGIDNPT